MTTARRPAPALLAVAAVVLVAVALVLADEPPPSARATLPVVLEQEPGVPFVLPVDLPDGVRLLGSGPSGSGAGGVAQRQVDFLSHDRLVSVCAELGPARRCQREAPGGVVERRVGHLAVTVVFSSAGTTPAERAVWRAVPMTADLDAVRW